MLILWDGRLQGGVKTKNQISLHVMIVFLQKKPKTEFYSEDKKRIFTEKKKKKHTKNL